MRDKRTRDEDIKLTLAQMVAFFGDKLQMKEYSNIDIDMIIKEMRCVMNDLEDWRG